MFKRTGLDKSEKNRQGVPDPKKFERTGEDTFVVHADGKNYFEGKINNPSVKLKYGSGIYYGKPSQRYNVKTRKWEGLN